MVTSGLPQKEVVERSASRNVTSDGEFSFACIGYSQMTAKMEREGALPLCDVGIKLMARRALEESTNVEQQASRQVETSQAGKKFDPLALANRATTALMKFWRKAFHDYPNKWLKFNKKMFVAMQKHAKYMGKLMYRLGNYATSWWPSRP